MRARSEDIFFKRKKTTTFGQDKIADTTPGLVSTRSDRDPPPDRNRARSTVKAVSSLAGGGRRGISLEASNEWTLSHTCIFHARTSR